MIRSDKQFMKQPRTESNRLAGARREGAEEEVVKVREKEREREREQERKGEQEARRVQ